jgi:type IV pilus assembly protein PilW
MTTRSLKRQSGLTLIELMVAMTLGMILTIAIGQIFMSSRFTHTSTNENARMQENARFALALLERELRMAGFVRNSSTGSYTVAAPAIAVAEGTGLNSSDEVTVRYFGSDGTVVGTADNTVINCIGEAAALNQAVVDTFYIAAGSTGEPSLFCRSVRPSDTTITTTTELLNGIESLQILVGEDTSNDKGVDRYLGPADASLNMSNAVAVKISLLIRSSVEVMEGADNRKYNHFGAGYAPSDVPPVGDPGSVFNSAGATLDKRMRRLFPTTVALRNRIN